MNKDEFFSYLCDILKKDLNTVIETYNGNREYCLIKEYDESVIESLCWGGRNGRNIEIYTCEILWNGPAKFEAMKPIWDNYLDNPKEWPNRILADTIDPNDKYHYFTVLDHYRCDWIIENHDKDIIIVKIAEEPFKSINIEKL